MKNLRTKEKCMNTKILGIFFFFSTTAHGALLHPFNDLKVIEAEVSRQGLTRITVQDDRILSVFGVTGEYVLETDENQGQIFIRPMEMSSLNPISLTLTTEKGRTQDLRLVPKEKAPEAIILQAEESSEIHQTTQGIPSREEIEELLSACKTDRIPLGYKLMPLDLKTLRGPRRLIREIRGEYLRGQTYEVKNTSQTPLLMAEPSFAEGRHVVAVLMPTKLLLPGEKAYVYVITKTPE